ncbi:hypothetical protein AMK59_4383 [Oryctes borbonicus]|uniref:EGF-like domain-containing protein n=1 Tax=Oryctes borbonicus TaxID=1629725 RepID=A0A0T6B8J5_9SCAR|nr:hypothetical protein AMK59_4383 [Oryctes borbonicus]
MSIFGSVQVILYLLPVLVKGFLFSRSTAERTCLSLKCSPYKTNETRCNVLNYVGDPVTGECIPKCTGPCNMGECNSCFCVLPKKQISSQELEDCEYVYNIDKIDENYYIRDINYCPKDYFISPYDENACVLRCSKYSCKHGLCSPEGTCVCHLGYRPDVLNPRTCTAIPTNPSNTQRLSCGVGSEPNINGDCEPSCTVRCKNEILDPNGVCECPEGYELDNTTSCCEMQLNNTDDDPSNRDGMKIMPNMSVTQDEKMPAEEMMIDLYTLISASIIVISLATVIVLAFVIIKLKQTIRKGVNPHEGQDQEVYSPNYYSVLDFEKKPNDAVVVENVELYGKSS